jgi:hypothetical protein
METGPRQQAAQIDDAQAVQLQALHSRSARRRRTNEHEEVLASDEMLPKSVLPRVEQGSDLAALRVGGADGQALDAVATAARVGKVRFLVCAAAFLRLDMLDGERTERVALRATAVLAPKACLLRDTLPDALASA